MLILLPIKLTQINSKETEPNRIYIPNKFYISYDKVCIKGNCGAYHL